MWSAASSHLLSYNLCIERLPTILGYKKRKLPSLAVALLDLKRQRVIPKIQPILLHASPDTLYLQ